MDYLAKLHWDAIVAQKVSPDAPETRAKIAQFNAALDAQLDAILQPQTEKPQTEV